MIYFDQAAALRPDPEVREFFRETAGRAFVNQEAAHRFAYDLRKELEDAGPRLARALTGRDLHVVWGSSGTDILRTCGMLDRFRRGKVRISPFEHPAASAAFAATKDGADVLIVYPAVESETGMLDDGSAWRTPGAPLLCDAIQAAGKLPLDCDADILAVSGHKLGGMGGAALLYRDDALTPEFARLRTEHQIGRPDPAQCLTLAFAAEQAKERLAGNAEKVREINRFLREKLVGTPLPGGKTVRATLAEEKASPYILHLLLPGMQTGVLVRMLGERGVACAAGSACAAESDAPSPTLLAMGFSRADAYSGLRLSFGPDNTLAEAEKFVEIFTSAIKDY